MDSVSINNVPQELDSALRELALLYVQCQSGFLKTEQNSPNTAIMFHLIPSVDENVIHPAYHSIKTLPDSRHGPLEYFRCATDSQTQSAEAMAAKGVMKSSQACEELREFLFEISRLRNHLSNTSNEPRSTLAFLLRREYS